MSDLLTIKDVARHCQIHEGTVRRHIAAGRLRSVRVGRAVRVRREDMEAWVDSGSDTPQQTGLPNADSQALPPIEDELRPFTLDDPLWQLVGISNNPDNWWVSSDKRRALAEAYAAKQ